MTPSWTNLSDPIFTHAMERPNQRAVVEGPAALTYAQFAGLVAKAGSYLRGLGIAPGERIGIALTNRADHFVLLFALLRIGATVTELPADAPPDARLVDRLGIARVFVEPDAAARDSSAIRLDFNWRDTLAQFAGAEGPAGSADAVATISLSSGSTGTPKGVVLTHRQILARYWAAAQMFSEVEGHAYGRAPPFLLAASLANYGFFRGLMGQFAAGGTVVPLPHYRHAMELVAAVANEGEAFLTATANMARAFLAAAPASGLLFPRLKGLCSTGQSLAAEEKRAIAKRVTPNFFDSYGATGTGPITCLKPSELAAHAESVGRAVEGLTVEIVDPDGAPLPAGKIGRLRCRGATLCASLAAAEDGGNEGFFDGWFYTGDLASTDAEGYVHLAGRAVELINREGAEFFPDEIEAAIAAHPAVREVAVVSRPGDGARDELVAFVVAGRPLSAPELERHCEGRLPRSRWPNRVVLIDAIPKLGNGKTDRALLRTATLRPRR